jgi:hypothetical protein
VSNVFIPEMFIPSLEEIPFSTKLLVNSQIDNSLTEILFMSKLI